MHFDKNNFTINFHSTNFSHVGNQDQIINRNISMMIGKIKPIHLKSIVSFVGLRDQKNGLQLGHALSNDTQI